MDDLAAHDVTFFAERRIIVRRSERFQALDQAATIAWLQAQPAQFAAPLLLSVKGGALVPVWNATDLKAAATLQKGGDVSTLEHPALARTIEQASRQGVEFLARVDDGYQKLTVPAFYAYQSLSGHSDGILWNSADGSQLLFNEDEALAHAFFTGQGTADGLCDGAAAQGLASLSKSGASLLTHHSQASELTPFEAYRIFTREPPMRIKVGVAGVPIRWLERHETDEAAAELAPYLQAYRDVMQPAGWPERTSHDAIERLVASKDSDKVGQARLMFDLYRGAANSGKHSDYELREKTFALYDWMVARQPGSERVASLLRWVENFGTDQARQAAELAWNLPPPAEAAVDRLMMAQGRAKSVAEALAVLPEPLPASAEAYCTLYQTLALRGDEKKTLECFKTLTARPQPLEDTLRRFLEGYVKTGSVERATGLLDEPALGESSTVEREKDAVVIGGIRVPRRPAHGSAR